MRNTRFHQSMTLCAAIIVLTLTNLTISVQSQEVVSDTTSSRESRELDLKFINAELALAKANLEFILEQNNKRAGSYSSIFIEELQLRTKLYQEWGKQLEAANPQFIPIDIQKAKGELKIAQMRLDADEMLRKNIRNSVSAGQLKRRRLAVEAAKAWLDKVSHPSYQDQSRDERIQWRFVVLGKNLLEMRLESQR
jgi:hypothetical protein